MQQIQKFMQNQDHSYFLKCVFYFVHFELMRMVFHICYIYLKYISK
ncbi:hypothetical protein pb186bvf_020959 [Paramecium bursaria]